MSQLTASATDALARYRVAASDLIAAEHRLFEIEQQIESVTDRIDELLDDGAENDEVRRARDKRRHLRNDLVRQHREVSAARLRLTEMTAGLEINEAKV